MTRKPGRPGITLIEVLTAMFVMALGLLALLTLFPLGAFQVAQALKDDRTSQTAMQADGYLRDYWRTNVVGASNDPGLCDTATSQSAFNAPNSASNGCNSPITGVTWTVPAAGQPSYPVLIDPHGYIARSNQERYWAARGQGPPRDGEGDRRTAGGQRPGGSTNALDTLQEVVPIFTLIDDMTFDPHGAPQAQLNRQGRYSWAAVLQRPQAESHLVAAFKVLVFDGRAAGLAVPGDEVVAAGNGDGTAGNAPGTAVNLDSLGVGGPPPSNAPAGQVDAGDRAIRVQIPNRGGDQINVVRRGGWVMDGTITATIRTANFYRIAGVTEEGADSSGTFTQYLLDLETPLKAPADGTTRYAPQFYFFAGLAEVFERPVLRPDQVDYR